MPDDEVSSSRELVTRADFLDGMACVLGGATLAPSAPAQAQAQAADPPAATGLRGQYAASYAVAHALRDGTFWKTAPAPCDTHEAYDLVVVGGGISGLTAAYFYRQRRPAARVLVLENLDDFGGHAKRNEFQVGARRLVSYGGSQSIAEPGHYSHTASALLHELGIEPQRFERCYDARRYEGLGTGLFFDRETFGEERLLAGMGRRPWRDFLADAPLSAAAKRDIARLYDEPIDYLPHLGPEAKRRRLARTSYADFLTHLARCDAGCLPFFKTWTNDLFALDIDAVSALEVFEAGDDYEFIVFPGFAGMDLGGGRRAERAQDEPYIYHFPDGNASVARLLVRKLVPHALPGHTMEDIVTANADYARLDRAANAVRIRLRSSVVRIENEPAAKSVKVQYVRAGALLAVRARHAVLACWNSVVPYICPEVPAAQKEALAYGVKAPLVYTHVAIRNWESLQRAGVKAVHAPGSYHSLVSLDFPVDIGAYRSPRTPAEPMVLWLLRTPCRPGRSAREQYRLGRAELYATSFETIERKTRNQLQRMFGATGFNEARDITAITVNRWAHGYAYSYLSLWDPVWKSGASPAERGRRPVGRIAIANSDSEASAYTDAAIDAAHRAVGELLGRGV